MHVLLAEGREDKNWDKAKENYQQVQHFIVRAEQLELYDDVSRMLPDTCKPDCIEMVMDIVEYNREEATAKQARSPAAKVVKRKRNDSVTRNIPSGASTGFVSVKDLLIKPAKRKKPVVFDPAACEDDDDDRALMEGILQAPRRAISLAETSKAAKAKKPRRASTVANAGTKKNAGKAKKNSKQSGPQATAQMSGSQLERLCEDDSDDKELEGGIFGDDAFVPLKSTVNSFHRTPSPTPARSKRDRKSPSFRPPSSPEIPLHSIIDLTTPDGEARKPSPPRDPPSSPAPAAISRSVSSASDLYARLSRSPSVGSMTSENAGGDASIAWLIADDDEPEFQISGSSPPPEASSSRILTDRNGDDIDNSVEILENYVPPSRSPRRLQASSTPRKLPSHSQMDMPPPALPPRFIMPSPGRQYEMPPPSTFAVRAPGKQSKKRVIAEDIDSSPAATRDPPLKRIQRHRDSSSPPPAPRPKKKKRVFADASEAQKHNPWIEMEANHSGDDRSVGSSGPDEDMDEYERSFVQDLPETQASPSYDQSAVYRQSLLSQAPARMLGPAFASKPTTRGPALRMASSSRQQLANSSPRRTDDEADEYVFGSFVVDDDEEIAYSGHSSS